MGAKQTNRSSRRRWFLFVGSLLPAILAVSFGQPTWHLLTTFINDVEERPVLPEGFIDDASRMNATQVAEVFPVPEDLSEAEARLAALLKRARSESLKVSIAGARHSMGGHTIYPGGIAIDMLPFRNLDLDISDNILTVGAGALWADVIPFLDERDLSVAVMQSNNSFSVGGSISVNCHGWQFNRPPIASSVESFRLMKADGSIVRCSREENAELFSLVLGGYGLFGIILDVRLRVVPNERYRLEQFIVPVNRAFATFENRIKAKPGVAMVYARLSVDSDNFLENVILNLFYQGSDEGELPPLETPGIPELRRSVFRGSVGSDYGKELRWIAETKLQPHLKDQIVSRNQLFNESADVFENTSADTTDILHEYFIPRKGVGEFIDRVKGIVPKHKGDLLNVTVRFVDTDEDSFLKYADQPVFAFVMLFTQPTSAAGDARMQAMTRELIDASLSTGGRYYLPYRLHASKDQFRQAYPQGREFFDKKRKYDPDERFQNQFYLRYGQ